MQVALCLKCGSFKPSPTGACPACQHVPADLDDQARHILVTDANFSETQLRQYAEHIRAGGTVEFSPDTVMTAVSALTAPRPSPHWWHLYITVGIVILIVATVLIIAALSR